MTINMLMFEYRKAEQNFFKEACPENYNITFFEECLTEELVDGLSEELLEHTTVISVFVNSKIDKNILDKFKNLRIVSTRSTAYDHICTEACSEKNIALVNVPDYGKVSVAQFTMCLIISLVRNIFPANTFLKQGVADYNALVGRDLSSLTLGIIGTGAIGGAVCELAKSFGMKVIANDLRGKQELVDKFGIKYVSLDEVAQNSDVISLHLPYYEKTRDIIDEKFLSKCKNPFYLVNTSSAELVDLKAILKCVKKGKLKGFAMDFLRCDSVSCPCKNPAGSGSENLAECVNGQKYFNELITFDNVIVTPHIANLTQDAIDTILRETFINIKKTIQGDKMCRVV